MPQLPQNLAPAARSVPHDAHLAIATGVPQLGQNLLEPVGLPQFVHMVLRVEVSPLN